MERRVTQDLFVRTLQKITSGGVDIGELIGVAGQLTESGEPALAQQLYRVWVSCNGESPQRFIALFNCSVLSTNLGDPAAAQAELTAALAVNPDFIPSYVNLGGVFERQGAMPAAMEQWNAVLARLATVCGPNVQYKLATLKQVGRVLGEQQDLDNAEAALGEALDINPNQNDVLEQFLSMRLSQCKWPVIEPREGLDRRAMTGGMHPLSTSVFTDDPLLQLAVAARYSELHVAEKPGGAADRRHAPIDLGKRRLRVGYVSSDLRDHAVGYLMAELFEVHDRSQVEVFAYYCGVHAPEGLQQRIKASIEHWREIRDLSDEAAAALIAADELDILVDVNGHTRDARTAVFARRPAPIQVNWLGYPGTMGTPYHQYLVADPWIIPPEAEMYFTEKVLRLPCYQPNDRKRAVARRPTRAEAGLPDEAFVFCCFNGSQKIQRFTFERWMEILKGAPGSVLWLLEANAPTNARLRTYAEAAGVDPARLVFAPKLANAHHLARYPLADLFLDTSPYGAHTTASDALWMGVPMITVSGRSFASRVCGSLVRSAGLPDLVLPGWDAYVAKALELAGDPGKVAALKARLEANRTTCDLFDMEKLAARLEGLYREMVADYRAGRLPRPDLSNLEAYFAIGCGLDHEAEDVGQRADYHEIYRRGLAERDLVRPLRPDPRLWPGEGAQAAVQTLKTRKARAS
ncbi:MAG: N-acetylglucosamine transferase [Alphaproteobacteria bacterium]|nr:N-acetylglucosamine transferase [Alphaproteobacteria bacterium]